MNVIDTNFSREILLFDASGPKSAHFNVLKEFIYFLKFSGKRGKIDFSFSGNEESSHPGLTIKENYILDSVPTSLIKDKEDNFQITADNLSNPHLKELIRATECLDRIIKDLQPEEKKWVSIAKALLSTSEYIFMDRPDLNMSVDMLKIAKAAMTYEVKENGRKIFIRPDNQEKWLDLATHVVAKNDTNQYIKTNNNLCSLGDISSAQSPSIYQFELVKKAG